MTGWLDIVLMMVFLSILLALASNRLLELIRLLSFQGLLVPLVPFLAVTQHEAGHSLWFTCLMVGIKGVLIPLLLWVAIRKASIRREIEPIVGYNASLLVGLGIILSSIYISKSLPAAALSSLSHLLLPCAITTMAAGFFLLMARRKAITQVIGYLMLENGIYLAGSVLAAKAHTLFVLEFGILLDLLSGVMVMGIIVHRINHTYNDLDLAYLSELKE